MKKREVVNYAEDAIGYCANFKKVNCMAVKNNGDDKNCDCYYFRKGKV